jgi:NTE family protein
MNNSTAPTPKMINLALQGGGAHGAFTWGVLDGLLEDGRVAIDGLSATSAGAMNAVVYSYGMMMGGRDGARQALHDFWYDVSQISIPAPLRKAVAPFTTRPLMALLGGMQTQLYEYGFSMFENFTETFSPYQFNPFNYNPLRDMLLEHVDFDRLYSCDCVKLFISATNVKNNRIKIFSNKNVTVDAVMASACLPMLFQAVEIEGEYYWDGGYVGNPALYPLFYETSTDDMVVVHINPIERDEVPIRPYEILNRVNEISFNSSLLREFRAIAFIQKMLEEGWIKDEFRSQITHKQFYMHAIRADEIMKNYSISSKFTPNWAFLEELKNDGRAVAKMWLDKNFDAIGKRSTLDIRQEYLKD